MSDDSLYQLMLREADDAAAAAATDDLRRGRRRLRRRRAGVAVAAACTVLGASVTAYGVSATTDTSGAPASHHDADVGSGFSPTSSWPPAKHAYARIREVVFDHTAYGQHTGQPFQRAWRDAGLADSFGYHAGETADETRLLNVTWDRKWHEGSEVGTLRVEVFVRSRSDAGDWGSAWMTQCHEKGTPHRFPVCEERTTADGKTVLVGIDRRPVGLWLRANWRQPDGTLVWAGFFAPNWPETQGLSLTVDDLMNVATDPRLTLAGPD
jgi:hypothetical protein